MMPRPGTPEFNEMIDLMRADLESDMRYTKLIIATKKEFAKRGRDFDKEFKEWQERIR